MIIGWPFAAQDEFGYLPCRVDLHAGDDVGVLLERERPAFVAEALADHLWRHSRPLWLGWQWCGVVGVGGRGNAWFRAEDLPDSLIDVIARAGRHYQPWVADATVSGAATVEFGDGVTAEIASTPVLNDARGVTLARYVAARSPQPDAVLDRADITRWFAGYVGQASAIPGVATYAQPVNNRPYVGS